VLGLAPAAMEDLVRRDTERWTKLIKEANVSVD